MQASLTRTPTCVSQYAAYFDQNFTDWTPLRYPMRMCIKSVHSISSRDVIGESEQAKYIESLPERKTYKLAWRYARDSKKVG